MFASNQGCLHAVIDIILYFFFQFPQRGAYGIGFTALLCLQI